MQKHAYLIDWPCKATTNQIKSLQKLFFGTVQILFYWTLKTFTRKEQKAIKFSKRELVLMKNGIWFGYISQFKLEKQNR